MIFTEIFNRQDFDAALYRTQGKTREFLYDCGSTIDNPDLMDYYQRFEGASSTSKIIGVHFHKYLELDKPMLQAVKVRFEDSKNDYVTDVSWTVTKADIDSYFIGLINDYTGEKCIAVDLIRSNPEVN